MTPYHVTLDVVQAYEHRTGFSGFGEFLERKGSDQNDKRDRVSKRKARIVPPFISLVGRRGMLTGATPRFLFFSNNYGGSAGWLS